MRQVNHIPAAVLVIAFTLTMAWPRSATFAADPAFQVPTGERQLFLDDVDIADIQNLARTMHRPGKKGAVIRPDPSLPVISVQIRMAPIWHPQKKLWQLWDCAASPNDLHAAGRMASGYYQSKDGLHWTKPVVGLVKYRGSKENNYINHLMGGKIHRVDCIIRDDSDPDPARRYKTVNPNCFNLGIGGTAVSPDGIHWTEISSPGLLAGDEWNLTFDAKEHLYIYYIKRCAFHGSRRGRSIWLSTSKDFETWTEPELILEADDLDQERGIERIKARIADPTMQKQVFNDPDDYRIDVYHMSPFRYESLYLGMPAMYHSMFVDTVQRDGGVPHVLRDGFHHVELACSRDLKNWTRVGDRKTFIGPSRVGSGAYDLTQIIGPASAVVRDDELWFYYTGVKYRATPQDPDPDEGAICLAVMRRDGYVSLDAGEHAGTIQSEPFKLRGTKFFVNVDAVKGELRVEVINGEGKVVAQSEPLFGDLLREPVKWSEGDIAKLKGQTASLRFTLRNGQFYSYWLE